MNKNRMHYIFHGVISISLLPPFIGMQFRGGGEIVRPNNSKNRYEASGRNFQKVGGLIKKSVGEVWIFSGATQTTT